jgi:DNA-binding NtrC family response regulator
MRDDGVLLVDPDRDTLVSFEEVLRSRNTASVETCTDFIIARRRLIENPPELLVTNLRLGEYNGLHLVHLAATLGSRTQCVVYSDHQDALLIREVRLTGAVYVATQRVSSILASYANAELSETGARDPLGVEQLPRDRRSASSHG